MNKTPVALVLLLGSALLLWIGNSLSSGAAARRGSSEGERSLSRVTPDSEGVLLPQARAVEVQEAAIEAALADHAEEANQVAEIDERIEQAKVDIFRNVALGLGMNGDELVMRCQLDGKLRVAAIQANNYWRAAAFAGCYRARACEAHQIGLDTPSLIEGLNILVGWLDPHLYRLAQEAEACILDEMEALPADHDCMFLIQVDPETEEVIPVCETELQKALNARGEEIVREALR